MNAFQKSIVVIDCAPGGSHTGREYRRPPVPGELVALGRAFSAFLVLGRGRPMAIERRAVGHYSRAANLSDPVRGSKRRRVLFYANSQKL